MKDEQIKLIIYKGTDVILRKYKDKYQIGIHAKNGLDVWFSTGVYDTVQLARTSGKEYACIIIDRMIVSRKLNKN
jgi:hypothetical protein